MGLFKGFDTLFIFRAGINTDINERWKIKMEKAWKEERLSKRSRIMYRFIREFTRMNWIREEAVEVLPLRKYPILPVRRRAAAPNYRDGMAWFILRGNFIAPVRSSAGTIPRSWDHENAILIMWPIRGHRGFPGGDWPYLRITVYRRAVIKSSLSSPTIIADNIMLCFID